MARYLVKRLLAAALTLLVAAFATSTLVHLVPGDPVAMMAAQSGEATPELLAEIRQRLGLDQPVWRQSLNFVLGVARGDLGTSLFGREPVLDLLLYRLPNTLALASAGLAIACLIGLPLGFLAAYHKGRWIDSLVMVIAITGVSIPNFWLGLMLLILFSQLWGLVPVAGYGWQSMILPAATLGFTYSAIIARMTRSAMIDVLSEDFIRTARAKGLPEAVVLYRHALKPALISVVTIIGLIFGFLMGGSVIVENIFSWNGIGRLAVQAMLQRDYPLVQGFMLMFAAIIIVVSIVIDLLYAFLDPRIAYG